MQNDLNQPEHPRVCPTDADLLDRLLAGEALADLAKAHNPQRVERVGQLLALLDQWQADDSTLGLANRTLAAVLHHHPVRLSAEDAQALDALLQQRREGLDEQGPMPAGLRKRAQAIQNILHLLEPGCDEPVPGGLVAATQQAIEQDRLDHQRRSAMSTMAISGHRQSTIGIRQIAATAALFIMALSVLLPMLSNAKHHAQVAQCSNNLAGLGTDLQNLAFDNKDHTHRPAKPAERNRFNPLAKFAQSRLDGSTVPANQANFFVLIDQQRVAARHLTCPAGDPHDPTSLYNGQNPAAGGPFRIFLKPRPIFADANPLYTVTTQGLVRNPNTSNLAPSPNHNAKGQNVLSSDGSVQWMTQPTLPSNTDTRDNIWLHQPSPTAEQDNDVFLTP